MAEAYADIFKINEYAHDLTDDKLKGLVVQITGKEPNDGTVGAVVGSFKACKQLADFDAQKAAQQDKVPPLELSKSLVKHEGSKNGNAADIRLAYTININLPETTDVNVYNAIFSSIRANLLTDD